MSSLENLPQLTDRAFSWRDGRKWFDAGLVLFKDVRTNWYLACMVLGLVLMLVSQIGVELMSVVIVFAAPILTAFMINCCHHMKQGLGSSFNPMWHAIVANLSALMLLALISAVLSLLFNSIHLQLLQIFGLPTELTESMVRNMSGQESLVRALLNLLTSLPLALALAFSPALIVLQQTKPIQAVKLSVQAVIKTWRSFLMLSLLFVLVFFGIVLLASFAIALVQMTLGANGQLMVQLIIIFFAVTAAGIGLCAQYQAYTEIFTTPDPPADNNDTEIYAEI